MDLMDVLIVPPCHKLEYLFVIERVALRYLSALLSNLSCLLFEVVNSFLLVETLLDAKIVHLNGSGKLIRTLLFRREDRSPTVLSLQ